MCDAQWWFVSEEATESARVRYSEPKEERIWKNMSVGIPRVEVGEFDGGADTRPGPQSVRRIR